MHNNKDMSDTSAPSGSIAQIIDIDNVIRQKNPRLAGMIPGFVLSYIKRIVHQDDVNYELSTFKHLGSIDFCKHVIYDKFNIGTGSEGLENIPKTEGAILVANHPLGGMDALALVIELSKVRQDFKFVVNDILLHLPSLKPIFKGVNTMGKTSKEALHALNALFASDELTVIFPAGLVSRKQKDGVIRDLGWRKTFVTQAKKHNKAVIPVFIDAPPLSKRFYGINKWRQKLGIKANLELFYLVDEQYRLKNKHIDIHFGAPIPPDTFDRSKTDKQWAEWVKERMYALKS